MNAQDATRLRFAADHPADVLLGHDTVGAARASAGGWGDSCTCTGDRPCDDHADQVRLDAAASDAAALVGGRESITPLNVVSWDPVLFDDQPVADRRPARWVVAVAAAAFGVAAGLLLAVALIPDQPDRIIVPVEQPAGVQAPTPQEWSA